jgi:predicted phosphodiesterase
MAMKYYTFYTDLHLETPIAIKVLPLSANQIVKENAYLLGDIHDLKGCESNAVIDARARQQATHTLFKDRFVYGNHDLMGSDYSHDFLVIDGHIILTHGDLITWDESRVRDFRNSESGEGYTFLKKMLNLGRIIFGNKLSKSDALMASELAKKYNCDTIVFGHTHTKNLYDKMVSGIRVINCPRGKTELYL